MADKNEQEAKVEDPPAPIENKVEKPLHPRDLSYFSKQPEKEAGDLRVTLSDVELILPITNKSYK